MEGEQQSPQTKEFFKRSDITTMAKQISHLREEEAEQEKGRVAGLKTAAETKRDIDKTERVQMAEAEKIRQTMSSSPGLSAKKGNLEAGMAAPAPPILSTPPISPIPSRAAKPFLGGRIFLKASIIVLLLLIFTNLYFSWKQNFSNEKLVPLFLSLFKKEQFLSIKAAAMFDLVFFLLFGY